jgi:hypothetical protein
MWSADKTRKPMLLSRLSRLSGLFLLRLAQRALSVLLIHEPPRNTRGQCRGTRPEKSGPDSMPKKCDRRSRGGRSGQ